MAAAAPIPVLAPVISTTLFFKSSITLFSSKTATVPLWQQHRRAGGLARFEVPVRLCCVLQPVSLVDFDLDLAGLHYVEQFLGGGFEILARRGIRHQRRTSHVKRAARKRIEVDARHRARTVAEYGQQAARLQAVEGARESVLADGVEHDRYFRATGDLLDPLGEILAGIDDRVVATMRLR